MPGGERHEEGGHLQVQRDGNIRGRRVEAERTLAAHDGKA